MAACALLAKFRMSAHRSCELRLVSTRILQVQLDVCHAVGHVKCQILALMHCHNMGGNAVVHDVVWFINHDVQQVKPAKGPQCQQFLQQCEGTKA